MKSLWSPCTKPALVWALIIFSPFNIIPSTSVPSKTRLQPTTQRTWELSGTTRRLKMWFVRLRPLPSTCLLMTISHTSSLTWCWLSTMSITVCCTWEQVSYVFCCVNYKCCFLPLNMWNDILVCVFVLLIAAWLKVDLICDDTCCVNGHINVATLQFGMRTWHRTLAWQKFGILWIRWDAILI